MNLTIKNTILSLSVFACLTMSAQAPKDEIKVIQGLYGMEKKEIVKEYISLTEAQAKKFWVFYDQYETERQKLGEARLNILSEYAAEYDNLKDQKADELIMRAMDNDMAFDKFYQKQYAKLKAEVGALKAAQFFQLENYLQIMIKSEIQDNIPFIGDLDKKVKK